MLFSYHLSLITYHLSPITAFREAIQLLTRCASGANLFDLRRVAARNLHVACRNIERACQNAHEFFVSRPVNGRRGKANPQTPVMLANHSTARGARHNTHSKTERAVLLRTSNQKSFSSSREWQTRLSE
jgi:hypothetical protein